MTNLPAKVSLIGLGKLGLSLAAVIADSGQKVIGIDIDADLVASLNRGECDSPEPGLQELIRKNAGRSFEATTDIKRAITDSDYTIILVQTPSERDGRYGLRALRRVLDDLCVEIKENNKIGHLISINSTIQPGDFSNQIIPRVEKATGLKEGDEISVCYNPELVALGTTIENFRRPDFVLIGATSLEAQRRIERLQRQFVAPETPILPMSPVSAEIVKISLNSFLTMKISFANLLSQITSDIENADIDHITRAIGTDKRIGDKFLRAGNSFGGTCFPRDVRAFSRFLEDHNVATMLPTAIGDINQAQADMLYEVIISQVPSKETRIVFLGASFKSDSMVIAESSAVSVMTQLLEDGYDITVYDRLAMKSLRRHFNFAVDYSSSQQNAVHASQKGVLVLYNADQSYKDAIKNSDGDYTLIDCWRAIETHDLPKMVKHVQIGVKSFAGKEN